MTRSGMKTISIINYTVGKSLLITLLPTISVDSAYNYFCQMHVNRHFMHLIKATSDGQRMPAGIAGTAQNKPLDR